MDNMQRASDLVKKATALVNNHSPINNSSDMAKVEEASRYFKEARTLIPSDRADLHAMLEEMLGSATNLLSAGRSRLGK